MTEKIADIMADWLKEMKDESEMTEKEQRILEASIKLFAEKGFHASSTSEIAKEAGVAEGTIFRHFKTKKDILLSLVFPMFSRLLSPYVLKDVKKIMEDSSVSTEEALKRLFKNRLALLEKNRDLLPIVFQEATLHPEIKEALMENVARPGREIGELFFVRKIKEGELRNLPIQTVVRTAFSLVLGYVVFKYIAFPDEAKNLSEDQEIEIMLDIFLNGVKNSPS